MKDMDYRNLMGVECLAASSCNGRGVTVAVLDSGDPKPLCFPACMAIGPEGDVDDEFGHATAVASILFGGTGTRGLCEGAYPLYVKVLDNSGNGSVRSVSDGIRCAIDHGADIINLSLGFARTDKCPKALRKACEMAAGAGKTIVCAAGNDGGPVNWPAALDSTICVGSAGENGLKTAFSSVGEVDFVAPGTNLRVIDQRGLIKTVSGTSYSAALVTGVAALLVKKIGSSDIDLVRKALRELAQDVDADGWDKMTGYGLISGRRGTFCDSTVCMKIKPSFFDRILHRIQGLLGLAGSTKQGDKNGRV